VKLKTYQAYTMAEALAAVKRDLGQTAVILHTRTFKRGGFLGLGRKTIVEVTATAGEDAGAEIGASGETAAARCRRANRSGRLRPAPRRPRPPGIRFIRNGRH